MKLTQLFLEIPMEFCSLHYYFFLHAYSTWWQTASGYKKSFFNMLKMKISVAQKDEAINSYIF